MAGQSHEWLPAILYMTSDYPVAFNRMTEEWVQDGATVMYGSASELRATLEYDFSQERDFSNKRKV